MKILRYLSRDVLTHTLAVSIVLLAIIISGRFVKYLAEAAVGELAGDILLPVMLYRMPGFLELILPLGLFIGILMAYGRLYVESEMVVLSACGFSPARLAGYTLVPAALITILVALLSLLVTPLGAARSEALLSDPEASKGLQALAQGRFQRRGSDGTVTYAGDIDGTVMRTVFVAQTERQGDQPIMVVTIAEEGELVVDRSTGARYLELREGVRYAGVPGRRDFDVISFSRFGERIPDREDGVRAQAPVDGRPTAALIASAAREDIAALHWRLSLFVMVPIVAIIALSMSRTTHRRGRYVKMAPALLLHISYLMLLSTVRSWIEEGAAEPVHLWLIHAGFLLLALILLFGADTLWRLRAGGRHAQA